MKSGKVIRSNVNEINRTGRTTQGVTLAKPDKGDEILSITLNEDRDEEEDAENAAVERAVSGAPSPETPAESVSEDESADSTDDQQDSAAE
jgi:DNA gyrase subunit A